MAKCENCRQEDPLHADRLDQAEETAEAFLAQERNCLLQQIVNALAEISTELQTIRTRLP